jgi:RimJ/RimL family protein N-acetyltransferase
MIELKNFAKEDFETFKSWVHSEEELIQFAGSIFTYPLTNEQLESYVAMSDKKPFKVVLADTNETIGHCELNFENGNKRLSRILVGKKELRNQNIGEQIVRKMVDLFFEDGDVDAVDLNVVDWNKAAIKCYQKVGFVIDRVNEKTLEINGKTWTSLNMILKRK